MTQTIQPHSSVLIKISIDEKIDKPEDDEISCLLLSLYDSLNDLYEKLSRLDYLIRRKNIEQILFQKIKEKGNENQN